MHEFLKAIGFSDLHSRKELKEIVSAVENDFSIEQRITLEENVDYCERKKEFGDNIGITVCGEINEDGKFEREYYYPYFEGTGVTSYADVILEKRMEKEMYAGLCEEMKVGVSLIFHLQNMVEYRREKRLGHIKKNSISVTLSALAESGTILFPIQKDELQEQRSQEDARNRMMLMSAAKSGDQQAIESLTLDDIDIYSQVSKRLITEDIFSIVDTYFMPYGVECDRYSIMGTILGIKEIHNSYTNEELYIFTLDVNELVFDVCVPKKSVMGEPEIRRRFKGNIWLQGRINFGII
ncbi:hypothetical protein JCM31739_06810 [Faecalimonas canis]